MNTTGALGEPGLYTVAIGPPLAGPTRGSDWEALRAGRISITPIDADRTANPRSLAPGSWSLVTRSDHVGG